jgi:hypothetical protein
MHDAATICRSSTTKPPLRSEISTPSLDDGARCEIRASGTYAPVFQAALHVTSHAISAPNCGQDGDTDPENDNHSSGHQKKPEDITQRYCGVHRISLSSLSELTGAVASGSQGGEQKLALHLCEESRKRSGDATSHCALNLLNQPIIVSQKPRLVKGILFWREYSL